MMYLQENRLTTNFIPSDAYQTQTNEVENISLVV